MHGSLTYGSYLKVDELLRLQAPKSAGPEHDEMLFIVIHQVYELWFKQVLHEVDFLCASLGQGETWRALHTLDRVRTIFKTLVAQVDILETMTPTEFLSFRDYLESSSGFQSWQFRELEFLLGHKRPVMLKYYDEAPQALPQLERRLAQPTLWDAFLAYLHAQGYPVPEADLHRDVTQPLAPSPGVQDLLLRAYREDPMLALLCERMVDLDEGIQEWRYRHVKMVERTIGHKRGTGGSPGVGYLHTTIKPLFADLWAIRSRL
jgi:tryptophan 2,3-dioxygenase